MKKHLKIALPLILCIALSSLFIIFAKVDYNELIKPKFAPPSFVFSLVWSIVYLIFYLCLLKTYQDKRIYSLYLSVLIMHTLWNLTFFFLGYYLIGLLVLVIIYFTSWIFVYYLSLYHKKYFYWNLLYLLWLMLALYLNIGIFLLN